MVALSPRSSSGQGGSSAAAAPPPPPPPPALGDSPYLGREERQLLEQGKAEHRETTKSARRALKVGLGPAGAPWRACWPLQQPEQQRAESSCCRAQPGAWGLGRAAAAACRLAAAGCSHGCQRCAARRPSPSPLHTRAAGRADRGRGSGHSGGGAPPGPAAGAGGAGHASGGCAPRIACLGWVCIACLLAGWCRSARVGQGGGRSGGNLSAARACGTPAASPRCLFSTLPDLLPDLASPPPTSQPLPRPAGGRGDPGGVGAAALHAPLVLPAVLRLLRPYSGQGPHPQAARGGVSGRGGCAGCLAVAGVARV